MQGTQPPLFRPTVSLWPAEPRTFPRMPVLPVDLDQEFLWWTLGEPNWVEIPDEFVLREVLAVDATSNEAVRQFVATWGLLTRAGDEMRSLPVDDRPSFERMLPKLREPQMPLIRRAHSLAIVRHHLRVLQTLARHYIAASIGNEEGIVAAWCESGFPPPDSTFTAWYWWTNHVNAALKVFPMRVDLVEEPIALLQQNGPTTYEVAALQLAQLASSERRVLRCANQMCGRAFTRQRSGRRQYAGTEHAEGVKYCSPQCAKAQSERERRRRRRDEGKQA